ncbi:MAG: peptide chain release factor N(5)-glutamine methyltransferase [Candidatus Krumholzibacteriota bacterium]
MKKTGPHKTIRELIRVTSEYLEGKGVASAKLNTERLLADVLGLSRIELFFQHDRPVLGAELDQFRNLVRRRAQGEPLQQILGETEFYSRVFKVVQGVFIPRPETERLVEEAVALLAPPDRRLLAPVAVEIGCGTGIIGISLALEVPRLSVYATDINPAAIQLAKHNAHTLGAEARVQVLPGNRFDPLPAHLKGQVDLVVSNPPYVRAADIPGLATEVSEHDPAEALDGGEDGLVFYRALASAVGGWLRPGGHVAVEIGDDQGQDVEDILTASGLEDIRVIRDYADRDRVVTARFAAAEEDRG